MSGTDDVTPYRDERWRELHGAAQRDLAAFALGESLDEAVAAHVRTCTQCLHDVAAYRRTIDVVRGGGHDFADQSRIDVPPYIWQRIVAELGLDEEVAEPPTSDAGTTRPRRWRRAVVAAAGVVALAAVGVGGWAIGHSTAPAAPSREAHATLVAQPGTARSARGNAVVHRSDAGFTMSVSTQGLPVPQGYYEVWLFDPAINQMVAVGTLGAGARGSFTVPAGLDLRAYHVIDVSAQKYNGNNAHQRSVLQGPLSN